MRTTEAEVLQIIDTDLTEDQIGPFIAAANVLVTNVLANESFTAGHLGQIELWLAAHFVAIRDPRIQSQKLGDASATYQGQTGMGLSATSYGQQVLLLDSSGRFAALSNAKRPAELKVIR